MLEFNIPIKKETTYTNLPSFMMNCVGPWLDRNNVEYEVLKWDEIPEELPQSYTFNGRTSCMFVVCIKSHMDSDALIKTAETMLKMDKAEI